MHCHVGSQGCEQDLLVRGARSVLELAEEINTYVAVVGEERQQVRVLDIGGGMAVDYTSDAAPPPLPQAEQHKEDDMMNTEEGREDEKTSRITPSRYACALQREVPELFSGKYSLVTEFGRYVSAKCAVTLSRVEYVKSAGGRRICVIHCGADLFLRTCYNHY